MRGPATAIVWGLVGLVAAGVGVTFLMKLQRAGQHADAEEERRPRSMGVDPSLPDWFRTLDRNTDGVVTRAEFVGTAEAFRAIDGDRDGAISPAEAHAADEWFRLQIPGDPVSPP